MLALLAVAGTSFALPRWLSLGPRWLQPTFILVLLVPTVLAHRTGRRSLNHALGIIISTFITLSLIGSVLLLVTALPGQKESPLRLLLSGAELWLTNILVFALWYWRLDGGGPLRREERGGFGSRSFLFPQMQAEESQRDDAVRSSPPSQYPTETKWLAQGLWIPAQEARCQRNAIPACIKLSVEKFSADFSA
jgi:hypothetical protein